MSTSYLRAWAFIRCDFGAGPLALAATFDCNKASNFAEKVICRDLRSTSMDDQLGR